MNNHIEIALNELYRRQISSREELLTEMLRVKMTSNAAKEQPNIKENKEELFQLMKKTTEEDLGFFPAARDDFFDIFAALEKIDLIEFTLEIYKNDRMGIIISPHRLTSYIKSKVKRVNPKSILITEAEKHLAGLRELVDSFKDKSITLTTQHNLMNKLLKFAFQDYAHVTVIFESIYSDCLVGLKFDYIYALPAFGYRPEDLGKVFMTKESDGIAMENLLMHLNENGILDIIVPAKTTFATQGFEKLRTYITENFNVKNIFILPEGTFRPTTAIKTYFFSITSQNIDKVEVGTLELIKETLEPKGLKELPKQEFLSYKDWRIELLLSSDDEHIQQFNNSKLEKVKLKEISEVFRGKSILKKDTTVGNIGVLNISDIDNGEIYYSDVDTIEEDESKIKRYELEEGDVVLSCRGTAIKTAVFKRQDKIIIASANLLVIRPKEMILGDYIKIFFESPVGTAIIKSFQRGTTIMNINHSDIMEMEIPLLTLEKQHEMVKLYSEELNNYKKIIQEAELKWNTVKDELYSKLI